MTAVRESTFTPGLMAFYNIARLRAKTKITKVLIRELLFADDAALTSHSEGGLQQLVTCFSHAYKEFGLTISLKKTNVMAQRLLLILS